MEINHSAFINKMVNEFYKFMGEVYIEYTQDKTIYIDLSDSTSDCPIYTSLDFQQPIDRLKKIYENINIHFGDMND